MHKNKFNVDQRLKGKTLKLLENTKELLYNLSVEKHFFKRHQRTNVYY
jgi:hypothetical protein